MKKSVQQEVKQLIKDIDLNCTIREFQDKVDWYNISQHQNLSEDFIREFKDKVFKDEVDVETYNRVHQKKTWKQKRKEMREYAKKHGLKFDGKFLYAFRNHDKWGRGIFNKTIRYSPGQYYRDWHCNMDPKEESSFGLGIWPKGNTPVKVKVGDWGVAVQDNDGKGRVWGFEILEQGKQGE